jgi:uncharacterized cupredoxin-like copper-binding protein
MRPSLLAWLVLPAAFAVGACGGDDEKSADKQPSTSPSSKVAETVQVTETDFKLQPANPKIAKSGRVRFEVRNDGAVEHSLEIEGPSGDFKLKRNLKPGEASSVEVNLEPGTYEWYCPVGDHKALGMRGEITVGAGAAGGGGGTSTTEDRKSGDGNSGSGSSESGGGSGY